MVDPIEFQGYEELLRGTDIVVVAQCIGYAVRPNLQMDGLETVYKFRLTRRLAGEDMLKAGKADLPSGVDRLAPLADDEFLAFSWGGTLTYKGVKIRHVHTAAPRPDIGRTYVLFLAKLEFGPEVQSFFGEPTFPSYHIAGARTGCLAVDEQSRKMEWPADGRAAQQLNKIGRTLDQFTEFLRQQEPR